MKANKLFDGMREIFMGRPLVAYKKDSNRFLVPLIMLGPFFAFLMLAFIVPDDILQNNPSAQEFCDFMARFVPLIDRITALDIKPDVNRFYFSVLWACAPFVSAGIVFCIWRGKKLDYPFWVTPPTIRAFCFFLFGFWFFVYLGWTETFDINNRADRAMFMTAMGRGIKGQMLCYQVIVPFATLIFTKWIAIFTGSIHRHIKRRFKDGTN